MRGWTTLTIVTCAACAASAVEARAADLHVPAEHPTIQSAIDAAQPGDTVLVAAGTYRGEGNRDLSFRGKTITVRGASGPASTVIDCEGTQEDPHRGFTFESGEGRGALLQGFTITNGSTPPGAIADTFNGAGILVTQGSSPTIRDVTIRGSWAGCWGGAICCSFESHPLIDRCTLVDNYTNDDGGGLFAWANSMPVVTNSVIANNVSRVTGGGITTFSGGIVVRNSTIVGNQAVYGAGVYSFSANTFENTIVWGNTGDANVVGNPAVRYSLVGGGFPGVGNVDTDPFFVDGEGGDYRLAANSPLVERGDPAFVPQEGETDAGGDPRFVGARVDVGAYEFQDEPCPADYDGTGAVGFGDLIDLLGAWGVCSGCPQDLDRNGAVEFGDLLGTLANWGPCP